MTHAIITLALSLLLFSCSTHHYPVTHTAKKAYRIIVVRDGFEEIEIEEA